MTNKEKFKEIFGYEAITDECPIHCVSNAEGKCPYNISTSDVCSPGYWWNAEYKETTTENNLDVNLISRADAIQAMQNKAKKLTNEDTINGLCGAVAILYEMPSVTPQEPRWIPVSEKLPEPFMFVNATCRSLVDDREDWVIETVYLPIPKEANKHGYSDWGNIPMLNWGEAEVIAWVERIIPQPYKAESEEA